MIVMTYKQYQYLAARGRATATAQFFWVPNFLNATKKELHQIVNYKTKEGVVDVALVPVPEADFPLERYEGDEEPCSHAFSTDGDGPGVCMFCGEDEDEQSETENNSEAV